MSSGDSLGIIQDIAEYSSLNAQECCALLALLERSSGEKKNLWNNLRKNEVCLAATHIQNAIFTRIHLFCFREFKGCDAEDRSLVRARKIIRQNQKYLPDFSDFLKAVDDIEDLNYFVQIETIRNKGLAHSTRRGIESWRGEISISLKYSELIEFAKKTCEASFSLARAAGCGRNTFELESGEFEDEENRFWSKLEL